MGTWAGPGTVGGLGGWVGGGSCPQHAQAPVSYPNCGFWITCILSWFRTFEGHYQNHANPKASAQGPHLWLASHQPGPSKAGAYGSQRDGPEARSNTLALPYPSLPSSAALSLLRVLHCVSSLFSASSPGRERFAVLRPWGQGARAEQPLLPDQPVPLPPKTFMPQGSSLGDFLSRDNNHTVPGGRSHLTF